MARILVVDDQQAIRKTLRDILEFEKYTVDEAVDGLDCMVKLKKADYDVVVMDIKMPKMDGMEALERVQMLAPDTPVIMISGHANIDTAVEAVKKGAFDFISKPPDLNRMLITVRNAMDKSSLITDNKTLKVKVSKKKKQEMVGNSKSLTEIKETIELVAPSEARVLVTGSNGTGKELVARYLHDRSPRSSEPLIEVNCAAIPSELIESELFGHEKGAFTGASDKHLGKFQEAHGGTLFLDEVGELTLDMQVKLLRAIQEGEIDPVGSSKPVKVDFRLISATNRNLEEEVREGNFREDLYYRLSVLPLTVPPLRMRREDIPELLRHFVARIAAEEGRSNIKGIERQTIEMLCNFDWPGNIRQLENAVFRAVVLCEGDELTIHEFPQIAAQLDYEMPTVEAPKLDAAIIQPQNIQPLNSSQNVLNLVTGEGDIISLEKAECEIIKFAIEKYNGSMSKIARKLALSKQ